MKRRAAIIGAGISGLTTAIVLGELGYEPVIFADRLPLNTTSAVAGAIWFPYDVTPEDLVNAWAFFTFGRLLDFAKFRASGVSLTDFEILSQSDTIEIPRWTEAIGYRRMERRELRFPFLSGYSITVPKMETPRYLPYLVNRIKRLGGSINKIDRLARIEDLKKDKFSVVINCSGFGAKELVPDHDVTAHNGQILVVPKSNRRNAMVCADPLTYVIPRASDCVLGGMNAKEEDQEELPADSVNQIIERCKAAGFDESCAVLSDPVGERPYRKSGVRVQAGWTRDKRLVIHNYGHGGCGLSLSWGCAQKVRELVETFT